MRKQFTFYRSFWDSIENLSTNKEKLQAYQLLCDYALNQQASNLESVKPSVQAVFNMVRPLLDRAHARSAYAIRMQDVYNIIEDSLCSLDKE